MVELQEIFDVKYGVNLVLNKQKKTTNGINFVSRTAKNNGVSAKVELRSDVKPIKAGVLTVAAGGSVLETFLQPEPFYSGRDLYYLEPKTKLTISQKLYYCACIRENMYKYNYGRQANKTLKNLLVPAIKDIPKWVNEADIDRFSEPDSPLIKTTTPIINTTKWKSFRYDELFDIERGESHYLTNLKSGIYPYISASSQNNGKHKKMVSIKNQKGNAISLPYDGSIGEAFYQPDEFLASEKIVVLRINKSFNKTLNKYIALFLCTLIRLEQFKYNYGLKWSVESRLKKSIIMIPVDNNDSPDWNYMESYIKTISFSSVI